DSVWAYDVVGHRSKPRRFIAMGRDSDAAPAGNEDNEPTGLHVSDGDPSIGGLLGTRDPSKPAPFPKLYQWFYGPDHRFDPKPARWFITMQHGFNTLFEILQRK